MFTKTNFTKDDDYGLIYTPYHRRKRKIFFYQAKEFSIRKIATLIKRNPSTVSRELNRNKSNKKYSPFKAQKQYKHNKKKCGRRKKLASKKLFNKVKNLFLELQWSPEQIAERLKKEKFPLVISYNTIYRAIYAGVFDSGKLSQGNRGCIRLLRHRGKSRHTKNYIERRGKIRITNTIHERPKIIENRGRLGDWEADTVVGKTGCSCLVTLVDRKSGYLICSKIPKKNSKYVTEKIIELLSSLPQNKRQSITPDRGKNFLSI